MGIELEDFLVIEQRITVAQGIVPVSLLPNADHVDTDEDALPYRAAFFRGHLLGRRMPTLFWEGPPPGVSGDLRVRVVPGSEAVEDVPQHVRAELWAAPVSSMPGGLLESNYTRHPVDEAVPG